MKNKISLIIYSLIALVPAVFIIIAFFGPEKDSAISLNWLDPFGFDDVKVTKKYDESEERLRKKREKFKNAVKISGIRTKNQHQNRMLLIVKTFHQEQL